MVEMLHTIVDTVDENCQKSRKKIPRKSEKTSQKCEWYSPLPWCWRGCAQGSWYISKYRTQLEIGRKSEKNEQKMEMISFAATMLKRLCSGSISKYGKYFHINTL